MPRFRIDPTPNPNSLKFTALDGPFIPGGLKAYMSASEAEDDPLGSALFGIEGVADILILPAFLTITKRPEADWDRILREVEKILERHFT